MMRRLLLLVSIVFGSVLLIGAGFVVWALWIPSPMPDAFAAMRSDEAVIVRTEPWLTFVPAGGNQATGLIIYPGARVDARAYAPLARKIAGAGNFVVVPDMPLNLAVFSPSVAEEVIAAFPGVKKWAIAGHSLGGTMAADFAERNPDRIKGLAFLASYPLDSSRFREMPLKVVSIYGTADGIATPEEVLAAERLLPPTTVWIRIDGGNHAQFAYYGEQSGDRLAAITREEQAEKTAAALIDLLAGI